MLINTQTTLIAGASIVGRPFKRVVMRRGSRQEQEATQAVKARKLVPAEQDKNGAQAAHQQGHNAQVR